MQVQDVKIRKQRSTVTLKLIHKVQAENKRRPRRTSFVILGLLSLLFLIPELQRHGAEVEAAHRAYWRLTPERRGFKDNECLSFDHSSDQQIGVSLFHFY